MPDIAAIEERLAAIDGDEWEAFTSLGYPYDVMIVEPECQDDEDDEDGSGPVATCMEADNAIFIAHARQDIPALLRDRKALLRQIDDANTVAQEATDQAGIWKRIALAYLDVYDRQDTMQLDDIHFMRCPGCDALLDNIITGVLYCRRCDIGFIKPDGKPPYRFDPPLSARAKQQEDKA